MRWPFQVHSDMSQCTVCPICQIASMLRQRTRKWRRLPMQPRKTNWSRIHAWNWPFLWPDHIVLGRLQGMKLPSLLGTICKSALPHRNFPCHRPRTVSLGTMHLLSSPLQAIFTRSILPQHCRPIGASHWNRQMSAPLQLEARWTQAIQKDEFYGLSKTYFKLLNREIYHK